MAPNPASNPHILGPKGHMGAHMGFTGSIFSMRSNSVGGCFAHNGPQVRENPFFQRFWPSWALKTAKYFQCAPLEGAPRAKTKKNRENCSVFNENSFFETATKNKVFNVFFRGFPVRIFSLQLGPQRRIPAPTNTIRTPNRLLLVDRQPIGDTTHPAGLP